MSASSVSSASSSERARLFVALELPAEVRRALVSWREEAASSGPELRTVPPESLHVTLCFLGWQQLGDAPAIGAALDSVASSAAAPLSLSSALWLPPRRPRVLAVQLTDSVGALARVQSRLSASLVAGTWYRPERRPFLAHVTVARVREGGGASGAGRGPRRPRALADPPALDFLGVRVTLYRSRLGAGGARYEALRTAELSG